MGLTAGTVAGSAVTEHVAVDRSPPVHTQLVMNVIRMVGTA